MFGLGKTWAHIEFFGENLPHPQNDCDRPSLAFQTSYRKQQASFVYFQWRFRYGVLDTVGTVLELSSEFLIGVYRGPRQISEAEKICSIKTGAIEFLVLHCPVDSPWELGL